MLRSSASYKSRKCVLRGPSLRWRRRYPCWSCLFVRWSPPRAAWPTTSPSTWTWSARESTATSVGRTGQSSRTWAKEGVGGCHCLQRGQGRRRQRRQRQRPHRIPATWTIGRVGQAAGCWHYVSFTWCLLWIRARDGPERVTSGGEGKRADAAAAVTAAAGGDGVKNAFVQ